MISDYVKSGMRIFIFLFAKILFKDIMMEIFTMKI